MSPGTAPHCQPQASFDITFGIDGTDYRVSPLDCDPSLGSRAFRFAKQGGDGAVYELYDGRSGWTCQCRWFLRHGHCKHCATLAQAGQLFGVPTVPSDGSGIAPGFASAAPAAPSLSGLGCDPARVDERVSDAQLAEAMAYAPEDPPPTEEEINAMARYFGQD